MGGSIKMCGQHVNTSFRKQAEEEGITQLTGEASEGKGQSYLKEKPCGSQWCCVH